MLITRTPMQDDDGTGTTGTILNNAWKQEFYNQIDGAVAVASSPMRLGPAWHGQTPAGQIDNWDLAFLGAYTAYIITPQGAALVTGIKAAADMTLYLLVNASAFTVTLAHYHSGSLGENRFFGPASADYLLTAWLSVWLLYDVAQPAWIVLKS
jgi:hypothetical protein